MTSGFSFAAWEAYCQQRVRPEHANFPDRLIRLQRLLTAGDAKLAWSNLAKDVTTRWPAHLGPLTWQEALGAVVDALIFPPNRIEGADAENVLKLYRPLKDPTTGEGPLPLMPAHPRNANSERNWVALYLKTKIIPCFFARPHHDDVARLVNLALEPKDPLSADDVRKLQSRHFRKTYRPRSK
jgi:hypothetical protein